MCRNIKPLHNFDPPATHDEIRDAALQFVRKLSGTTRPSQRNEAAFNLAVERIAEAAHELLHSLETSAHPRNREEEAAKARARSALRFAS
jgi:hypothetical protein